MREKRLIKEGSPCDLDYRDKNIQSVTDAMVKGPAKCSNYEQCKKRSMDEDIQCSLRSALDMAGYILDSKAPFERAVQEEAANWLHQAPEGNFWVNSNGEWQIISGKKNIIKDVVDFALIVIDRQPDERRPFTADGKKIPELGVSDAMHNAALDLVDLYAEIGQVG